MRESEVWGKTRDQWIRELPALKDLVKLKETFWENPALLPTAVALKTSPLTMDDILDAEARLKRFAPMIAAAFPETAAAGGIIESPLKSIPSYASRLRMLTDRGFTGSLMVKCDSHLPVSGSIKARGGIYEVLHHAESLAMTMEDLKETDNYTRLLEEPFRSLFSRHELAVGSTGNLGLSIGIMGARLGFRTTVHMSRDARQWKKDLLRGRGVTVLEYDGDYSLAVEEGRKSAGENCHFVDDENSTELFLGYATAALRLKGQLEKAGQRVDSDHPLFVYLPCGVGGGPGGVAFGLKLVFGDAVHCFFAEPTHSPCMLLGLMTGCHDKVSVQDFGIDNITSADGLAVGRASGFVGKTIEPFLSGCCTVSDETLFRRLKLLTDLEDLSLEPSALAGFTGPEMLTATKEGRSYLTRFTPENLTRATHIAWATGGGMVPEEEMKGYYKRAEKQSALPVPE